MSAARDLIPRPSGGGRVPLPFNWAESAELFGKVMLMIDQAAHEKPLYMTLKEASRYTGLSRPFLRKLIRLEIIHALRDGGFKVKKSDLDSLPDVSELSKMVNRSGSRAVIHPKVP